MNTPVPGGGTEEVEFKSMSGYTALVLMFLSLLAIPFGFIARMPVISILAVILFIVLLKGIYMLQPNQSALLMLFGDYRGTDYSTGLRWANPFFNKNKVSLRLRNFNSEKLKVNDKRGNPIEIAANVVWRVNDSAQATFDVDDYQTFVN
ncbi:MAG TPA: SPFH domain-containing protein, partial [Vicinamibacterales bacterium]|nr:SPFH domain-containing protein [Vicinamibacterales bacterium]